MGEVTRLPTAMVTPSDLLTVLGDDAPNMRLLVAVVLLDDGTWHVRHSTALQSLVHSAAIRLLGHATVGGEE